MVSFWTFYSSKNPEKKVSQNIKGIVHPKIKILSLITLMSFQTHKTFIHHNTN